MTFLNSRAPSGHRICSHLRTKEMFYNASLGSPDLDPGRARVTDPDQDDHIYWCTKTCRNRGPGGVPAGLDSCAPSRECYRA
ncbi:MAG: hypothetical protein V2A76_07145 [Planctomycetota bacterium]